MSGPCPRTMACRRSWLGRSSASPPLLRGWSRWPGRSLPHDAVPGPALSTLSGTRRTAAPSQMKCSSVPCALSRHCDPRGFGRGLVEGRIARSPAHLTLERPATHSSRLLGGRSARYLHTEVCVRWMFRSGADAASGELGLDLALRFHVAVDLHAQLVGLRQVQVHLLLQDVAQASSRHPRVVEVLHQDEWIHRRQVVRVVHLLHECRG